jgi:hypothetical protein
MTALNLTSVPLTVSLSFMALFGWVLSYIGMLKIAPLLSIPPLALATLVAFAAFFLGTGATSLVVKPLAPLFKTQTARKNRSLVGMSAEIMTGRVDDGFGQAEVKANGDFLLVQVRCDRSSGLEKGDHALIIRYDKTREAFIVERLSAATKFSSAQEEVEALERAASAAPPARQSEKD